MAPSRTARVSGPSTHVVSPAVEEEPSDEVGGREVVVARDGDERTLEVVGHRLDEPRLPAAGRTLEEDRQALPVRGPKDVLFVAHGHVVGARAPVIPSSPRVIREPNRSYAPYLSGGRVREDIGVMNDQGDDQGIDLLEMQSTLAREPQPTYRCCSRARRCSASKGSASSRARTQIVEHILRNPDVFSSNFSSGLGDLKNRRPLIPLQTDPPDHRKYRKLLDPLFAPQRMAAARRAVSPDLVNELIDAFVDDDGDRLRAAVLGAVPVAGVPDDARPSARRAAALRRDEGRRHSARPGRRANRAAIPRPRHTSRPRPTRSTTYFEDLLAERAGVRRDDLVSTLLDAEVDGDRLSHEEMLDICFLFLIAGLDTVTASLDCFFGVPRPQRRGAPTHRRASRRDPRRRRGAAPLGDAGDGDVPRRDRATEVDGCPVADGDSVIAFIGAANLDDDASSDAGAVRLRPRREPPPRVRRRHPPVPRLASRSTRAARRAARVASPHPGVSGQARRRARRTRRAFASLDRFPMLLGRLREAP